MADSYEVVPVNDVSPDRSWAVIDRLAKQYSWVRGIDLMRNYGQHNATLCGIQAAQYEVIFTMDDDLSRTTFNNDRIKSKQRLAYFQEAAWS